MNKIMKKCYLIALFMIFSISSVHAASISFTASGTVTGASGGNDFALDATDVVSAAGVFDNTAFTGAGLEEFATSLTLGIGAASFTEADDIGATNIVFQDGAFLGFNFSTEFDVAGPIAFFDSFDDFFSGEDDNFGFVEGTWDSSSYSVVPVPAALWLMGSGLIGLAGVARRKQK